MKTQLTAHDDRFANYGCDYSDLVIAAFAAAIMALIVMEYGAGALPAIQRIYGPLRPGEMTWEAGWQLRHGELDAMTEGTIKAIGDSVISALIDDASIDEIILDLGAWVDLPMLAPDRFASHDSLISLHAHIIRAWAQHLIIQATALSSDDCRVITVSAA